MMCECHKTTFCPDEICIGYEDDVPVFVRRDSAEGKAQIAHEVKQAQEAKLREGASDLLYALEQMLDDMGDDGLSVCPLVKKQAIDAYEKATGRRVPT